MKIKFIPVNGDYTETDDPEYIEWCKSEEECIQVSGMKYWVANDSSSKHVIIVRANHWGSTYKPLTQWLKDNNIEWDEF